MEYNIGPFRVDTDGDQDKAREALAQMEQLRWILGGMLETKDLEATWPFRVIISRLAAPGEAHFRLSHGQYIAAIRPNGLLPLVEVASLFLDSNTSRLPPEVDDSLPRLFDRLEAHGSRVIWAKRPEPPDLNWARVQMFATKPEYRGRFPIFLNNLRGGALLAVAEANAFGKDSKTLEKEVADYFAADAIPEFAMSARPLDPKRDVGEHRLEPELARLYLADTQMHTDRKAAEEAYKAASVAGHQALAQEGFATLVVEEGGDAREYFDAAIAAGSRSAQLYADAAEGRPAAEAIPLLQTARQLNSRWWLPPARLGKLLAKPAEQEAMLAEACQKNPRAASLWQQLAELQSKLGNGKAAQNSWAKAEDAAATPEERDKVHARRVALENQRLDAIEEAKKRSAEEARREDERLRNEQLARIRAAEEKANRTNEPNGTGDSAGGEVLPWWNAGENPVEAMLLRVDCLNGPARLIVRAAESQKTLRLLVEDPSKIASGSTKLGCGVQEPARRLVLTYRARVDRQHGTAGDVISLRFE